MAFFIISINGLVGLIDFLQFGEVFLTMIIISIVISLFRKRGLCYSMEWASLIAGTIWTVLNLVFIWKKYDMLQITVFGLSALSFWYGLLFSICSSLLIKLYVKNKKGGVS